MFHAKYIASWQEVRKRSRSFLKKKKTTKCHHVEEAKVTTKTQNNKIKLRWVNIRTGKHLKTEITDAGEMVHKLGTVAALP